MLDQPNQSRHKCSGTEVDEKKKYEKRRKDRWGDQRRHALSSKRSKKERSRIQVNEDIKKRSSQ